MRDRLVGESKILMWNQILALPLSQCVSLSKLLKLLVLGLYHHMEGMVPAGYGLL